MRFFLIVVMLSFITIGCGTQSIEPLSQKMKISFIKQEPEKAISLQRGLLRTRSATVENWPFEKYRCDQCTSTETNHFTPKGPEKRISIYNKNKDLIAFVIESRSSVAKLNAFTFKFSEGGHIEICSTEECENIYENKKHSLSSCTIILTDYQYTAARKNIADSGNQMFQVAGLCQ